MLYSIVYSLAVSKVAAEVEKAEKSRAIASKSGTSQVRGWWVHGEEVVIVHVLDTTLLINNCTRSDY